jgi:hypothetical protein
MLSSPKAKWNRLNYFVTWERWSQKPLALDREWNLYLDHATAFYWITEQVDIQAGGGHSKVKDMFMDHHFHTTASKRDFWPVFSRSI